MLANKKIFLNLEARLLKAEHIFRIFTRDYVQDRCFIVVRRITTFATAFPCLGKSLAG